MAFSFAFLAGVLALLLSPALPPLWLAAAACACALALGLLFACLPERSLRRVPLHVPRSVGVAATVSSCSRFAASSYRTRMGWVVCGLAVGFLYAAIHAHLYLRDRWPASRADERVIAQVLIDDIPVTRGDTRFFDAIVTIEAPSPSARPIRARLTSRAPEVTPHAGDRWRLLLSLRPPRARVNPGTADLERMLFHDRIHALGTVVSSSINIRLDTGHHPLDALRERIAARIDARVIDRDAAALIAALAVGVTGAMSREQWRVFNATGTTHLVAISGLHVTLFAVVAFALARTAWSMLLYRWIPLPRETFAAVIGFAAATGYATLAGLSVPTQRTLIMLGAWLFTRAVARASPPFHSFALALVAVLVLDPFAPLAGGFWLSFGAMAAIVLVASPRFTQRSVWVEALTVQAAVTVALMPLTLAAFASVSLVGPLVNLVTIPAMSWIFVPTVLLAVVLAPLAPPASDAVLSVAEWMHDAGWPWLARSADVPWALVHASPPIWWYALAALGITLSLMPWPRPVRLALLVWIVPLALSVDAPPPRAGAEITVLDVGEATAIVVRTAHHVLVYDTADAYGADGRRADTVLIPFLRSRGVRAIDTLIVSRLSAANAPGLTALLAEMPIRETLVGGDAHPDFDGARACRAIPPWQWDGVSFHALSSGATAESRGDICILSVEAHGTRALLPGDIDRNTERALVSGGLARADLVIAPRHGSDAASSPELIRALAARSVVVSGRREREGREKPAIRRWRERGAEVLATDDLGAITFRLDPARGLLGPVGARAERRTLWRSPP